jgi:hypothetical protein
VAETRDVEAVARELAEREVIADLVHAYNRHSDADGSPDGELRGRYLHHFRRTPAGWRIASLRLQAAGTVDLHRASTHPFDRRRARGRRHAVPPARVAKRPLSRRARSRAASASSRQASRSCQDSGGR